LKLRKGDPKGSLFLVCDTTELAYDWQKGLVILATLTLIWLVGLMSRALRQKINRLKEL
jgi:hypothetical protein